MKKTFSKIMFATIALFSTVLFANPVSDNPGVNSRDLCIQPTNWHHPQHWHFNAVRDCQHIRCTLVDESGGVPDPDPAKNNYWENIDWTFSQNGVPVDSNQCTAFPLNPACDFNTPRRTCAALFVLHYEIGYSVAGQ